MYLFRGKDGQKWSWRDCIPVACYDENSFEVSVWLQVSELFSMCTLLSAVMRARACWVDKLLSSATAGKEAEAVSALQYRLGSLRW